MIAGRQTDRRTTGGGRRVAAAVRDVKKEPPISPKVIAGVACAVGLLWVAVVMWLAGQVASLVSGRGFAAGNLLAGVAAVFKPVHPEGLWGGSMAGPWVYWPVQASALLTAGYGSYRALRWWLDRRAGRPPAPVKLLEREGVASIPQVRSEVGPTALVKRAESLRPVLLAEARDRAGLARAFHPPLTVAGEQAMVSYLLGQGLVALSDFGWKWGMCRGDEVWTSVRDSVLIAAPSGAGKGVYTVINAILDCPGAAVVTSTRPDSLTPTFEARRRVGPVAVLSADGAVAGLPNSFRWSPIRGCEDGGTAQVRAEVLAAGTSEGVQNSSYWETKTKSILQVLLHAAALGGRSIHDLWLWSKSPNAARAAVAILDEMPARAEPGWVEILREVIEGPTEKQQNEWGAVVSALAGLDVLDVRERFNPAAGEEFDVTAFLYEKGTLYLLCDEGHPASRLLAALIADVVRVARMEADASVKSRLDPPLTLILDEIANFSPLPKLPEYLSAYGGSGIVARAYLQSLAQARDKWGDERAAAMWGSATVKVILRGGAVASDLKDLETLVGERDEETWSSSRSESSGGGGAQHSVSSQVRKVAVLTSAELRQLDAGQGLMIVNGAPPILVQMQPYYDRDEYRDELRGWQDHWENLIIQAAKGRAGVGSSGN